MRNMVAAALMAGVLLPLGGAAHAADLDYPYEPPRAYYPPPPPMVYRPLVVRPVPVARLYPRPYPFYGPRAYPRPYYPGPLVRGEPRPDFEGRPYPPREVGRLYPHDDREGYGRPYAREDRGNREGYEHRYSREDDRRDESRGRDFSRGYRREDGRDYARGGYGRDDRYADRRDLPPRGDYER